MSKILAQMLDKPEDIVKQALDKLEAYTGYPSEDARLIAGMHQASKSQIAKLDLDPHDTTAEELYQTLLSRFEEDSNHLDKALSIDPTELFSKRVAKAVALVGHAAAGLN